jgi:HSP20 family molecular chaperone IbpA
MAQQQDRKDRNQTNQQGMQTTGRNETGWRDPLAAFWTDPFGFFQRDLWPSQRGAWPARTTGQASPSLWAPEIETFQRGDQFVVRADLPGLKKEDVNIDLADDAITIQGERREEREEDREGYYRSERTYGSFYRVVPLPEGAITESAKAGFKDGVLEITVQAPPREVSRRRRLEIGDSTEKGNR